jgi:chitinase
VTVTNALIEVRLSAASTRPVRVHYATAAGSAIGDADYQSADDVLTFAPGETVKTISIPIFGDDLAEGKETFTVTLSAAENATIGTAQTTVTITDDDVNQHRRAGGH